MLFKKLVLTKDNKKYIIDYYFSDFFLRIFSILWICYSVFSFHENLNRPKSLYEPIILFQKIFLPKLPSPILFYIITIASIFLCIYTIINKKIIFRIILFVLLLWLYAVKWNYNFFSHVGHLFLLTHLFTLFTPPIKLNKHENNNSLKIKDFSEAIRWSLAGILVTYSMAGFWKFLSLFYKLIYKPDDINWLSENAVELNAAVSKRIWDEHLSDFAINLYKIDYIWEIGTFFIFLVQLFAVLGAVNKKISYYVCSCLIIFHIYNIIYINTSFYVSIITLIIMFFPYHKIKKCY